MMRSSLFISLHFVSNGSRFPHFRLALVSSWTVQSTSRARMVSPSGGVACTCGETSLVSAIDADSTFCALHFNLVCFRTTVLIGRKRSDSHLRSSASDSPSEEPQSLTAARRSVPPSHRRSISLNLKGGQGGAKPKVDQNVAAELHGSIWVRAACAPNGNRLGVVSLLALGNVAIAPPRCTMSELCACPTGFE